MEVGQSAEEDFRQVSGVVLEEVVAEAGKGAEEENPDYDDDAKVAPSVQMAMRHKRRMYLVKTPQLEPSSSMKHLEEQMDALKPKLQVACTKVNAKKVNLQP